MRFFKGCRINNTCSLLDQMLLIRRMPWPSVNCYVGHYRAGTMSIMVVFAP